jgi:ABC-type multidrug transport system permease subunit
MLRFALLSAWKDLRRRFADPAALLMWVGLPVVLGLLMSLIGGDDGPRPKAHLLLVDEDKTIVSGLVARAGGQSQLAEFLEIEPIASSTEGRRRMDNGDATALLILPKGFQDAVLREQPATLTLVTNPSQRILPVIIKEGLSAVVEAAFYAQRLFGEPIQSIVNGLPAGTSGPSDALVASVSQLINQRLRVLQSTLLPPVVSIEARSDAKADTPLSFGALFLPGLLFMALLFTAQGMSLDVWTEKASGTLRRVLVTPQTASGFLAGKVLAGTGIMAVAACLGVALGVALFHVSIVRAPVAVGWAAFSGAALMCYLVLLHVVATGARGAQLLSSAIVFPLMMIGGSMFPFDVMPQWMQAIGHWTPNGLAVVHLKRILFTQIDGRGMLVAAVAIGVPALAAFALAVRRLAGPFAAN